MDDQLHLTLREGSIKPLNVSQLVRLVREALETGLDEYWVAGEVSNAKLAPSGHLYFTLKDARSSISAIMFRSAVQRLRITVSDGLEVLVHGRVNLYEPRGALQLYAEEIEPRGLGALQLALEQLKQRLNAEGLFDPARKRPLPFLPRTIGIVTARGGAAIRDILATIDARYRNLRIILRSTKVQGLGAAAEIADALDDLNRQGAAEVIIIGRGGGSMEDLWAFNEEAVARAIVRSTIPVVSAVGHEIDFTIADLAADVRASTPTAAAQLVVPRKSDLIDRIGQLEGALTGAFCAQLLDWRKQVAQLSGRVREPDALLQQCRQRLDEAAGALIDGLDSILRTERRQVAEAAARALRPMLLHRMLAEDRRDLRAAAERLGTGASRCLTTHRQRLAAIAGRLDSLSPLRVLERGYAVVTKMPDGRIVTDKSTVEQDDELAIRLARGSIRARVVGSGPS